MVSRSDSSTGGRVNFVSLSDFDHFGCRIFPVQVSSQLTSTVNIAKHHFLEVGPSNLDPRPSTLKPNRLILNP